MIPMRTRPSCQLFECHLALESEHKSEYRRQRVDQVITSSSELIGTRGLQALPTSSFTSQDPKAIQTYKTRGTICHNMSYSHTIIHVVEDCLTLSRNLFCRVLVLFLDVLIMFYPFSTISYCAQFPHLHTIYRTQVPLYCAEFPRILHIRAELIRCYPLMMGGQRFVKGLITLCQV